MSQRQTQPIRPDVLPLSLKSSSRLQRKADYTFSFCGDAVSAIYDRLEATGTDRNIGHTIDSWTSRLALFSGIEVKREGGSKDEALTQLAIWLCAGLENHRKLAKCPAEDLLPVVGWTVVGHDWHLYIAYRALNHRGLDTVVRGISLSELIHFLYENYSLCRLVLTWK
ncbi:hypothetical protein K432DRAFT_381661 [Lepidopterella palustris CBS 459.81]|uniref:PD-(D/E)XK nuclease-like domain-containing protein n=1 Tax=Lepidopterella palustris CBS 459.81 TaxID=1314670 RepID=A0A8E2EC15_9PEZI|nr:hypothetical protein K432DRAFT_381661 [Lepidopterella palustris CBS 459.81]